GAAQSVSGSDALATWAQHAARVPRHPRDSTGSPSTAPAPPAAPSPFANGRACGGGLFAGPNTSCEFAQNVQDAYNQAPGLNATVRVSSPVTGQTYTMDCSPAGSGVTCSGGNNASVSW